jgi:hypothetical protein
MIDFNTLSPFNKVTFVFQFLTIGVAFVGIGGNVATFVVLSRRTFTKYSFPFYLRVKMCTDIVVRLHSFRHFAAFMLGADMDLTAGFVCKLAEYSVYVAASISLWHLTLIGVVRFISIVYPQKFQVLKKRQCQLLLTLLVTLYNICIYLPMPIYYNLIVQTVEQFNYIESAKATNLTNSTSFYFNLTQSNGSHSGESSLSKSCSLQDASKANIIYLINLANLTMLTFGVNNILTELSLFFLFRSRKKFAANSQAQSHSTTAMRDRKFAINSVGLDLICFVCKTPLLVRLACSTNLNFGPEQLNMLFTIGVFVYTIENAQSPLNQLFGQLDFSWRVFSNAGPGAKKYELDDISLIHV